MKPVITDHALVRWLERACGQDMEAFRARLAEIAQPCVDARVMHAEIGGVWFVFNGPTLVTVVPEKPTPRQVFINDRGKAKPAEPMPWQAKKRKRREK